MGSNQIAAYHLSFLRNNGITDKEVGGSVFGGGNAANVIGTPTVTVTGTDTRITGNVFGGGNQGDVSGSPVVTVGGAAM